MKKMHFNNNMESMKGDSIVNRGMRINKTHVCVFILIFFCTHMVQNANAQKQEKLTYKLVARPLKDSVLLRWAPTDYQSWIIGNKYGYNVWRGTVLRGGKYVDVKKEPGRLLNIIPLKPVPLNQWEKPVDMDDYAGVAAQAIYGDDFGVETNQSMSMVDIFNKENEQTSRFSFALMAADMSVLTAKLSGLWWTDTSVKSNETYLYKVWPANHPENLSVDTAYFYTGPSEYLPLPKPINLKGQSDDKVVNLQWDNQLQANYYNAFYIERSDDGGKTFKRRNEQPLINTTPEGKDDLPYAYYMDSLAVNYKSYYYRIVGISPFGELSPPSDTLEVVGHNKIKYAPHIISHEIIENSEVVIEWEMNESELSKVEGYKILRSDQFKEGYEIIKDSLSALYRKFSDKEPIATAYYKVQPYNRSGIGPASQGSLVQLQDSIPPAPPIGIVAIADTTGVVKLNWKANTEKDLYGYRIYRANGIDEEFSQITKEPIKANAYTDYITLQTLSKYVYYKLLAIDKRQNYSEFSNVFQLKRPDIVPPAPPAIRELQPVKNGVFIQWVKSSSVDVEQLAIYRNQVGKREWHKVKSASNLLATDQWTDSVVLAETEYRYLMMAIDSTGNESKPTKPLYVKTFKPQQKPIEKFEGYYDKKQKCIVLKWTNTQSVQSTLIYRKTKDGSYTLLDSSDKQIFYDYKVSDQESYFEYKIREMINDQLPLSGFSNNVRIDTK